MQVKRETQETGEKSRMASPSAARALESHPTATRRQRGDRKRDALEDGAGEGEWGVCGGDATNPVSSQSRT